MRSQRDLEHSLVAELDRGDLLQLEAHDLEGHAGDLRQLARHGHLAVLLVGGLAGHHGLLGQGLHRLLDVEGGAPDGQDQRRPDVFAADRELGTVGVRHDLSVFLYRTFFKNCPVYESFARATSSGVPPRPCAAAGAALGAEVDDPVGGLDDVQVVLDDDDGVARRRPAGSAPSGAARCRRSAGRWSARRGCRRVRPVAFLASSFDSLIALRLAARQRGRRLAQLDVAEADLAQRLQLLPDLRDVLEELARLRHRHVEDVGDARLRCSAPPASRGCSAGRRTPRTST